jgi:hypothetical protein
MTNLDKPVTRQVETHYGTMVVEVSRAGVRMRLKGTRTWYAQLTWNHLWIESANATAMLNRKDRPKNTRRKLKVGV